MINKKKFRISYSRLRTIIEYLLIIALYYVTGGAFSYTNYSTQIIVFFLLSLWVCYFTESYRYALRKTAFLAWLVMSIFVMIVPVLFSDSAPTYIAIVMQLGIGLFCASIIPPEIFKQKFIKVMLFFASISLVGYTIGLIYPDFAQRFPLTVGDMSVDYYNAGVYVFMRAKGYGTAFVLMNRNAGICWEPGCYQAFLNIALLFLLDAQKKAPQKRFYLKFILLLVTVITTASTNGFIIMGLLLMIYFPVWFKWVAKWWMFLPVVAVVFVIAYYYTPISNLLEAKLGREFGDDNGFLDRISIFQIRHIVSENGLPYIFGMSFAKWVTYEESLWNSVVHSFLCLGIPFTVTQLIGYWKGGNKLVSKKGILFLVMLMCASTETLFWRVFFNTIAFYGWIGHRED